MSGNAQLSGLSCNDDVNIAGLESSQLEEHWVQASVRGGVGDGTRFNYKLGWSDDGLLTKATSTVGGKTANGISFVYDSDRKLPQRIRKQGPSTFTDTCGYDGSGLLQRMGCKGECQRGASETATDLEHDGQGRPEGSEGGEGGAFRGFVAVSWAACPDNAPPLEYIFASRSGWTHPDAWLNRSRAAQFPILRVGGNRRTTEIERNTNGSQAIQADQSR